MRRAHYAIPLLLSAACGGQPALGQAPRPPRAPDRGVARPYLYEVANEQLREPQATPFIEVSGSASAEVTPDRARLSFAVESQGQTAAAASGANADAMDGVVRALRSSGAQGLRVETFGYVLRPDYSVPSGPERTRQITGYTAVNNVRVTLLDVAGVGRMIDLAIGAGANRVSSLAFDATDTEPARSDALTRAVREATMQAETMATALGRALGPPLEVRGGAQAPTPRLPVEGVQYRAAMEMAVETPIEPGAQTVHANVTIRFALGAPTGGP
jgi:uncharacterized protein YggE